MTDPFPADLPLAEVLLASGRELDGVARMLLALETEMLGHVGRAVPASDAGVRLQQIDLVMQTVRDLARLMRHAARSAPAGSAIGAEVIDGALTLEHLRARFRGQATPQAGPVATGAIELF